MSSSPVGLWVEGQRTGEVGFAEGRPVEMPSLHLKLRGPTCRLAPPAASRSPARSRPTRRSLCRRWRGRPRCAEPQCQRGAPLLLREAGWRFLCVPSEVYGTWRQRGRWSWCSRRGSSCRASPLKDTQGHRAEDGGYTSCLTHSHTNAAGAERDHDEEEVGLLLWLGVFMLFRLLLFTSGPVRDS